MLPRSTFRITAVEWFNIANAGASLKGALDVASNAHLMAAIANSDNYDKVAKHLTVAETVFSHTGFMLMDDFRPRAEWTGGDSLDPKNTMIREPLAALSFSMGGRAPGYLDIAPGDEQNIRAPKAVIYPDDSLPTDEKLSFAMAQVEKMSVEFHATVDEVLDNHSEAGNRAEVMLLTSVHERIRKQEAAIQAVIAPEQAPSLSLPPAVPVEPSLSRGVQR